MHFNRLLRANHSEKQPYRVCIKYPLYGNSETLEGLRKDIEHDSRYLYGATNLSDYQNGTVAYSVMDFWLDAIKAGGIFQPTASKLKNFVSSKNIKANSKIIEFMDQENLSVNLQSLPRAQTLENKDKLAKKVEVWFLEEYRGKDFVLTAIRDIVEGLASSTGNQTKQKEFLLSYLGLDRDFFDKEITLTYFLHPDIPNLLDKNITLYELLEQRYKFLQTRMWKGGLDIKKLQELLGLSDNFNALSHFLGKFWLSLKNGSTVEMYKQMLGISNLWQGQEDQLKARLDDLSAKAKLLPYPKMANHWGDYRSSLGGKLLSWSTNYFDYTQKSLEKFTAYKKDINLVIKSLEGQEDKAENVALLKTAKEAILMLNNLSEVPDRDKLTVLGTTLAELRTGVNEIFQKNPSAFGYTKNEELLTFDKAFPELTKPTPKYPEFFGDSKLNKFKAFEKAKQTIENGLAVYNKLDETVEKPGILDETHTIKFLDGWITYLSSCNTGTIKNMIAEFIASYSKEPLENNRYRFYVNPNNPKSKLLKTVNLEKPNAEKLIQKMVVIKENIDSRISEAIKNNDCSYLIDWIEFCKRYYSFVLAESDQKIDALSLCANKFPQAEAYLKLNGLNLLPGPAMAKLINRFVSPEIKGAINLKSRKNILERSTLQMVGALDKWRLAVKIADIKSKVANLPTQITAELQNFKTMDDIIQAGQNTAGLCKYLPHHFVLHVVTKTPSAQKTKAFVYHKSASSYQPDIITGDYLFRISSSPEQLQFLEMTLGLPKRYVDPQTQQNLLEIRIEEPSLITEHEYTEQTKTKHKPRVYLSVPFKIWPIYKNNVAHKTNKLGVDLGEYGVAYSVITLKEDETKMNFVCMEKGFLYEPQFRAISSEVAETKARQLRGTFSMASSALANLRESAHKSIKNRLHFLATKYNAQIVYERQVDAFETAGNRVKKLYRTIKRGDVYPKQSTDEPIFKQYWGSYDKTNPPATEIGAYGTSYFCPKCRKSIYQLDRDVTVAGLEEQNGYPGVYLVRTDPENMSFYIYCEKDLPSDIRGLIKCGKLFSRPPLESVAVDFCRHKGSLDRQFSSEVLANRGSQPLFVCPFCLSCYDADVQASINIAIKRVLFEKSGKSKEFDFYKESNADKIKDYPEAKLI